MPASTTPTSVAMTSNLDLLPHLGEMAGVIERAGILLSFFQHHGTALSSWGPVREVCGRDYGLKELNSTFLLLKRRMGIEGNAGIVVCLQ